MKKFYFKIAIILSLVAALEIQLTCSINVDELFNKLSYEEKWFEICCAFFLN